jgi:phosphoglucosamine mutase
MEKNSNPKIELKYFGTDGFRGEYGKTLTDAHAEAIGRFLGTHYGDRADILIGMDTRRSSPLLEAALIKGIRSVGGTAYRLGVCPTPLLSFLTRLGGINAAVMITASHNPACDNGIKLFGDDGEKLPDEITYLCEKFIDEKGNAELIKGDISGKFVNVGHMILRWEKEIQSSADRLDGLKIGLDCANGATYDTAPRIFKALGAEVHTIGCAPSGDNINLSVGSTHPEALAEMVRREGLDMGFAFDGDGDRCIAIDKSGSIIDGDGEMFILAKVMKEQGELGDDTVVCTVMSNGGFIHSLEKLGIKCSVTAVGDRFVAEEMKAIGATLGGEQAGHLIIKDGGGNGIYTALKLAGISKKTNKSLSELTSGLTLHPQLIRNIRVKDKNAAMSNGTLLEAVKSATNEIGASGRILLRPSGTENLIRLMVEHENPDKCKQYVDKLAKIIEESDGDHENEN